MKFIYFKIKYIIILLLLTTNVQSQDKIIYLDMNLIINNSKAGQSINTQMQKILDDNNSKYQSLEKKLRKEEEDIVKKKNILEPEKFKEEVLNFKKKINVLKKERNQKINDLKQRNIKAKNELVEKVTNILAKYSAENNIDLVLNKESIILGKKTIDITDIILDLLNKEVKKIKY